MCDLSQGFRLCTCDDDVKEFDWVLQWRDETKELVHKRGRIMMPHFSRKEQQLQTTIVENLNQGDCFDFEYKPQDGDVLILKIKKKSYRFRFEYNEWGLDESTSLTGWRAQMVYSKQGKIEVPTK